MQAIIAHHYCNLKVHRSSVRCSFLQVYKDGILKLSLNCAKQALKSNVKRYIEISTAQVYSCDKV